MSPLTFSPPPAFRPHPLACNRHVQTILPYYLHYRLPPYRACQHAVRLDDGDTIVLHDDCPPSWSAGDRIVVLVHGLAGCHRSAYIVRLVEKFTGRGYRLIRMDMRGCGAGRHLARGVFHADRSGDLLAAIQYLHATWETSPMTICGFSMGANLTLKMLGCAADQLPAHVDSAVAVEPPIDLAYCCHRLSRGWGRIYDRFFARVLWRDFHQRRAELTGGGRINVSQPPRSLVEFDRQVTAPLAGFATADDYYDSASAGSVLPLIRIPAVIVTAVDDPIVPLQIFEAVPLAPSTSLFVVEGGGHLGFFGSAPQTDGGRTADFRWLDWRLIDWVEQVNQADGRGQPNSIVRNRTKL